MNPKKMVRKLLPNSAIRLAEDSYRKGRVYSLQAIKGFPASGMRVIGVTGTNGKTTTVSYINSMLKTGGYKTALYSTALIEVNGRTELNRTHRTVPLTLELIKFFKEAKLAKVDFLIVEVTSQALDQHKFLGIPIEIAVMTNLTQDHLDYHGTMEAYAACKARLFDNYSRPKVCVLNADDNWFGYFKGVSIGQIVTYGEATGSSLKISRPKLTAEGSDWTVTAQNKKLQMQTQIPGRFNIQNASAAVAVGVVLGLKDNQIEKGIADLDLVPGRMQKVSAGQDYSVIVDYAHTPDALQNVLTAARVITRGKVIVVFGATGDRDRAKRPIMGKVAAKYADFTVLTDDETYTEDPRAIRSAVRQALELGKAQFTEVADRTEAFKKAFDMAKPGDVVVLAGMGHQDTRNMGGRLVPWSDAEVATKLIKLT